MALFLVSLKEHLITANVPGLGLGGLGVLEEIHRTNVVDKAQMKGLDSLFFLFFLH